MKFLILALCLFALPSFADSPARYVSVRGEGEIKVKPDLAVVNLMVHTRARTAKEAQEKNAKEMSRVQKVLKGDFSIEEKDIQTASFNVSPEHRYEQNGKQVFLGYGVNHQLAVTVRKLARLGDLLDALVGKGTEEVGVNLQGLRFDAENRKAVEIDAMELAMKNALARAEALARFAKKGLKGVLRISDSSVNYQPYRPPMEAMMDMGAAKAMAAPSTMISAGEIIVSSNVAVDYELN